MIKATLSRRFAVTAATLGDAAGVKITFGGSPSTDGRSITLPPIPEDWSEEKAWEFLGDLTHECGHIRFTDFAAKRGKTPFERSLENALEDTRIERAMGRIFQGAERLFRESQAETTKDLVKKVDGCDKVPASRLITLYVLAHTEGQLLCRPDCNELARACRKALMPLLGKPVLDQIGDIAMKVEHSTSTQDVMQIRKELMKVLAKVQTPEEQSQQSRQSGQSQQSGSESNSNSQQGDGQSQDQGQQDGGQQGQSESGSESNQSSGKGEQNGSGQQDGQSQQNASAGGQQSASETGQDSQDTSSESQPGSSSSSGGSILDALNSATQEECEAEIVKDLQSQIKKMIKKMPKTSLTYNVDLTGRIRPPGSDTEAGRRIVREARERTAAAGAALSGIIRGKARVSSYLSTSGRGIDGSKIARLAVGNTKIFKRREESVAKAAAVHVLLDLSGSMRGKAQKVACAATLGLVGALEKFPQASCGFSVFPARAAFPPVSGSHQTLGCVTVKGHDERLDSPSVMARVANLAARGNTPLEEALQHAELRLLAQPQNRKVLFVITDGDVSKAEWRRAEAMTQAGWSVFGIFIGVTPPQEVLEWLTDGQRISDLEELRKALFEFAKRSFH